MKKVNLFLIILSLLGLTGCANSSPVAKTISLKDFDMVELGTATKTICVDTAEGIVCNDIPDSDSYSISENTKGERRLLKLFVDDYETIDKLLHTPEARNNDVEATYLTELRDEYVDWFVNNENYKISLSRIKGKEGDTVKVKLALTDKGKKSAEKLGYKFVDTSIQYKIIDGQY